MAKLIIPTHMNTHRNGTHQRAHGCTTKPNVRILLCVCKVLPGVTCMSCQCVKQFAFVFLQSLPWYAIVAACLQELAILLVPLLITNLSKEIRYLAKTDFLQSFLSQSAKKLSTRNELTKHFGTILTCLFTLGRGKSVHQALLILYFIASLLITSNIAGSLLCHQCRRASHARRIADDRTCCVCTYEHAGGFQCSTRDRFWYSLQS